MQGRHTSINVQFSGTQECMIYFCGSNNFGDISKYFWHLPFWSRCTLSTYLWSWRSPPGERQLVILTSIVADAEGGGVVVHLVPGVLPTQSSHAVASEIVHSSEIIQLRYLDILKAKFHALSRFIEDRTLWIPIFKINLWIRILDY